MLVSTSISEDLWLGEVGAEVRRLEDLGYDAIRVPETKHDSFLALSLAVEHTERARVGTGVAIAFPRSPYITAHIAWDLQEFSKGRILIGLGTQVKGHNERRFSVPWVSPSPRLREYVEMMRAVWHTARTGEKPDYEGNHYRYALETFRFNPGPIDYPDPKIALAAVRPRNTRIAAEVADGVMWHSMMSWKYRQEVLLPEFEKGARAAGKDPKDLVISGGGFVFTEKDEELLESRRAEIRRQISFYASTRSYQDSIKQAGYEDEAALLHRLSIEQRWAEMAKVVTDDFVDAFAIVATWDELPARLAERYAGASTEVRFDPKIETPEDEEHAREVMERIRAIPAYGEVATAAV